MLGEKLSEEPYSREDKDLLLRVAEQTATALDYSGMIVQAAEQERIQRELQIAQDVQARLLPHDRPPMQTLRYAGACRAALGVGGDYFDFIKISDAELGVAVGDISGKGISAALLMASLHALLRSHATSHVHDLEGLARELNEHLFESTDEARFATLFFAVYDDRARLLRCLNAGHVPPLILRAPRDGRAREVQRLHAGGTVLGMFPEERFEIESVDLHSGDLLLVYSDGVTEAANSRGDLFGESRLIDALRRHADCDEDRIVARILADVDDFMAGVAQQDDITLIAARVV
jgi:sigma-B regulation protein RsbU (phosphoserine phosphatase)